MTDADVIVVGAGLGGLSAAVHLARAGLRVLVLEQGKEPGGLATVFQRGAFRFEASLHLMDSVGPGEPNRPLVEALGLHEDVRWVRHDLVRRELWADRGWDLRLPQGVDGAAGAWSSVLPGDRQGIRDFFAYAERMRAVADQYLERGDELPHGEQVEVLRLLGLTAADLLGRFVSPEGVQVLGTLAGYQALAPEEMAALPFLVMMDGYHRAGAWYVRGGSRAIHEALVGRIVRHKGRVQVDSGVVGATVERDRIVALRLADGRTVRARRYVAAVSPLTVLGWAPDGFPARYRERIQAMRLSRSLVRLSLGLDADPRALWGDDYETWLMNWKHQGETQIRLSITTPTSLDPDSAPAGQGVVAITTVAEYTDEPYGADRRAAEIERLMGAVERHVYPGLAAHTLVQDLSHPHTYERFAGVPRGAVFGFEASPTQSGSRRLGARTPITNLVFAGGWVFPGAGQVAALWSGRIAARHLLQGDV